MVFDYAPIAATASNLLEQFGKATAFVRVTPVASSDPAAGTVTPGSAVNTALEAVQVAHNEKHTPGALIKDGDLFWVVDGVVNIEDELLGSGILYNVVQVWPVKPGDTLIVTRVQTRGGVKS